MENRIEVKYETFIKEPFDQIKRIYQELNLSGFKSIEAKIKSFLQIQKKLKTYQYNINNDLQQRIYTDLKEVIDLWDYTI